MHPFAITMLSPLPCIVLYLVVEHERLGPARFAAHLLYVTEQLGRYGQLTVVVFIIGGAAGVVNKAVLYAARYACRHVEVEVFFHAHHHFHGLVVFKQVALAVAAVFIVGADGRHHALPALHKRPYIIMKAMLMQRALLVVANGVGLGLFLENFLL